MYTEENKFCKLSIYIWCMLVIIRSILLYFFLVAVVAGAHNYKEGRFSIAALPMASSDWREALPLCQCSP